MRHPFIPGCPSVALVALLSASLPAFASEPGRFCGGAATPGDPSDLANVVGDQTLEYTVELPASVVTCARGYLLEKCGDHESAHKVFDKCIAAGYVGAMIWKALLLSDGAGVARDDAAAAALMHRAATSDDPHYAPLGKLHYATALYEGRGVSRNIEEALKWFWAAAADGNEEAREFLSNGYHTGSRDQSGMGVGAPTAAALAGPPQGNNASLPGASALRLSAAAKPSASVPPAALPPAAADPPQPAETREIVGQRLTLQANPAQPPTPPLTVAASIALLAAFAAGALSRRRPRQALSINLLRPS